MSSFTNAVDEFIKNAEHWLSADDLPALATLTHVATRIDSGDATPALISSFGITYRALLARKPNEEQKTDELEALLSG